MSRARRSGVCVCVFVCEFWLAGARVRNGAREVVLTAHVCMNDGLPPPSLRHLCLCADAGLFPARIDFFKELTQGLGAIMVDASEATNTSNDINRAARALSGMDILWLEAPLHVCRRYAPSWLCLHAASFLNVMSTLDWTCVCVLFPCLKVLYTHPTPSPSGLAAPRQLPLPTLASLMASLSSGVRWRCASSTAKRH